jgi:hypothetical protein
MTLSSGMSIPTASPTFEHPIVKNEINSNRKNGLKFFNIPNDNP